MDVKQKILETIKTQGLFDKGTHIVLGLSGGPDSVCLFDVLCRLCESEGYHLHPVHVNHKFRPGAAEKDQEYVENLCKERGLECHSFVVDCNELAQREGLTSEEAGRKARYDAFFAIAQEVAQEVAKEITCRGSGTEAAPADITTGRPGIAIAVAQNANDQAETILFRMLRGTGIDGLAGIAYKRFERGIPVVRPLLDVPREAIEKYCEERNLSPRIDHTNNEAIYARNKIRLELLPMLREKFNPNIIETINRLGKNAAADKDYLARQAMAAYEAAVCEPSATDCRPNAGTPEAEATSVPDRRPNARTPEIGAPNAPETIEVFAAKLEELHPAVRVRVYNRILADIGMKENITEGQLMAIEKVMLSQSPSAMCDLADGFRVYKMYDRIRFCRENTAEKCKDGGNQNDNGQTSKFRMHFMTVAEYRQRAAGNAIKTQGQTGRPQEQDEAEMQGRRPISGTETRGQGRSGEPRAVGIFALPPGAEDKICIRKRMDGDVIAIAAAGAATQDGTGNAGTPAGPPAGQGLRSVSKCGTDLGVGAGIRHKKLQDFFVDAKVPKHLRDEIDLLAYGNRILWVLPSPHFAREDYRKKGRFSAEFRPEVERSELSKAAPVPEPSSRPTPEATGETTQGPAQALTQGPAQALTQDPAQALTQGPAQEPVPAPAPKATGKPEAAGAKAPAGGRNNAPETILVLEIL